MKFTPAALVPSSGKLHPLIAPLDVSRIKDEKGVKRLIKQLLEFHGYFTWMPAANGYGAQGVLDHLAIKDGIFLSIEAKFGYNKPTATQRSFAAHILVNDGYAFCVNEKNIDHLAMWLESFHVSVQWNMAGNDPEALDPAHGSRMLNALAALTEPFQEQLAELKKDAVPMKPNVPFL